MGLDNCIILTPVQIANFGRNTRPPERIPFSPRHLIQKHIPITANNQHNGLEVLKWNEKWYPTFILTTRSEAFR
jgi:hypothetical protein